MDTASETDTRTWRSNLGFPCSALSDPFLDSGRPGTVSLTPQPDPRHLPTFDPLSGQDRSDHFVRSDRFSLSLGPGCEAALLRQLLYCEEGLWL